MANLILVAGMSRGGTNLLWNIIQSHPMVIDSYYELNEIFGSKTGICLLDKFKIESRALIGGLPLNNTKLIRDRIRHFAQFSFNNDPFNKYKSPDSCYQDSEFEELIITTKLVSAWETDIFRNLFRRNDALKYLPQLEAAYPGMRVVFLVRNGLAVAEGWGRRGADIETAAYWYRRYVLFYEQYVKDNQNRAMIMRFEDLLEDPFACGHKVFDFVSFPSDREMALRIAIKPTIRSNHQVVNTTEKSKVWINKDNIREFLDDSINEAQIEKLDKDKRNIFIERNRDLLERYQYI